MNIRMVLLASAAAFAASTPVLAADAIVAAEPEPVEYVRVCDAYGTGYFYIPGTETCLKIEGYIRFQVNVGDQPGGDNDSDWDAVTRGQVQFTAKSDTEYGPLTGVIVMQFNADNATDQEAILDSAYLDIAGFRAGLFYSWWDDGLSGETDDIGSVVTLHNSMRYQYESGTFYAGLSVDELEDGVYKADEEANNVGVAFGVGGTAGAFSYQVTGGWDFDNEDGAIRAMGTVDIGPGTLGLAGVYSSGPNSYYSSAEWAIAAEYAIKATDKLKITPAVQYYGNYFGGGKAVPDDFDGLGDAWKVGLTVDYQIVDNFYAKASVQYLDPDDGDDSTTGYFRLQRSF
ncbi:membrane protein [Rhizobium leguminosarum bv. trifolii CB782]|uniref:Porin n=1 Tax=Rhizobium hidalgonense TaxID=1538159 RepID=A0A2A6KLQ0_9HYPH|nr:porin [Rhizobium hidalgonense]AHG45723.1 membrane protein [Rhizobium leguminosarum bv. trifolii CB782]MDR9771470.1 porin [Rhizobium hidalgonense]MDR9803477.1 porin [Rhizobium hidalgonense]MDR9808973.1 porin [Rhizobium hidalgonense]MDR9818499.1 porin [Rhizobium hidalgonense]